MTTIKPLTAVDQSRLRPGDYLLSLVEAGLACGLIDTGDLSRLQRESLTLLAEQAKRQSQGDSTSLKWERAQHLLASIRYGVGEALKTAETPEAALAQLTGEPLQSLYARGLSLIGRKLLKTQMVHQRLAAELFDTPNSFYQATIRAGIPGFFKLYDPETGAQETHMTPDYPVSKPLQGLTGIAFVSAYTEALYYENKLLRCFRPKAVHRLLLGVHPGYEEIPLNLYEPVLAAALGCRLAGRSALGLALEKSTVKALKKMFARLSRAEAHHTLWKAWQALRRELAPLPGLDSYVTDTLPRLAAAVKSGARVFYSPIGPEKAGRDAMAQGEALSDEAFRALVEEVAQCRYLSDQLSLIRQKVHSLDDLEELLLAGCLDWAAMTQVTNSLSAQERALLLSRRLGAEELPGCRDEERQLCQALRRGGAGTGPHLASQ